MDDFSRWASGALNSAQFRLTQPETFLQLGLIAIGLILAWLMASFISTVLKRLEARAPEGAFIEFRAAITGARKLTLPITIALILSMATRISLDMIGAVWLVRIALGVSLIILIYGFVTAFTKKSSFVTVLKWIGVIVALFYIFGWLDDIIGYMDRVSVTSGNINITLYGVVRTILFGIVLFWLGRMSNDTGQRVILERTTIDPGAREVLAKLFQIAVYSLIVVLLLNVMGVDLTALAVFGGALGIGLGVGLQAIASNFISGLIILLDRSITVGDYIELEDGRAGTLRELTIRSATLETFDGKDIMVPNETFITTAFVNWTHNNTKQRYALTFQVAYATDLERLFDIVREVVASHPKVLSGDDLPIAERPDAEIAGFAESGIDILVEFWMEGIDDGDNRVGADLLLMIWTALKANGIEIPFPQREVKVLNEVKPGKG
jgi:small-conductance mechanosensitive channel